MMNLPAVLRAALAVGIALVSSTTFGDVSDTPTERRLSLPGSARALMIPRDDWVLSKEQHSPGDTAVYYMLSSESHQMFLSVYIDRTNVCQSAATCLEAALKNPKYADAKELRKSQDRQLSVAQFFLDQPQGTPLKQANLLASAYVDGLWFDMHVSKAGKGRPEIAPLLEFLQKIAIQ